MAAITDQVEAALLGRTLTREEADKLKEIIDQRTSKIEIGRDPDGEMDEYDYVVDPDGNRIAAIWDPRVS